MRAGATGMIGDVTARRKHRRDRYFSKFSLFVKGLRMKKPVAV
jgi:diacylglycerol kinase family enzyme